MSEALYFYEVYLSLKEADVIFYILFPYALCLMLGIPLWVFLAGRFGKKDTTTWGLISLGLLTAIVYRLLPEGNIIAPFIVAVVGGVISAVVIIPDSLVADIGKTEEDHTGNIAEGAYFGLWKMGSKISRSVGIVITGLFLWFIGFEEGAVHSNFAKESIGYLFGPGVGGLMIAAGLIFHYYFIPVGRYYKSLPDLSEKSDF